MADVDPTADVNPYAPPSIPDPLVRPDPGVGVWRDGNLFVSHRDALLPPICVRSGGPATGWIELRFSWIDLVPMSGGRFTVRVPLSQRSLWERRYGTRIAVGVAVVAFAILPVLIPLESLTISLHRSVVLVDVVVGLIAVLCAIGCWHIVGVCRVKRDYIWFAGAHRRFLDQLPSWPGID